MSAGEKEKVSVTVDIFGSSYKLSGHSTAGYMKQVAEYVNEQMHRIAAMAPRMDLPRIAVLAAVNMADECFKLRDAYDELMAKLREAERLVAEREQWEKRHAEELAALQQEQQKLKENNLAQQNMLIEREKKLLEELRRQRELQDALDAARREVAAAQEREQALLERLKTLEEAERQTAAALEAQKQANIELQRKLAAETKETAQADSRLQEQYASLLEEHRKLQEEYVKLQNEFNEWIELVDREQ